MAGTITVDTIQSDSSYTSTINIASPVNFTSAPTMGGQAFASGSRNIIINGGMRIAQRNTSSVSITGGDTANTGYYTVDRFSTGTRHGSLTVVRDTDVPTGQGFTNSLKLTCNSTSSNTTHNWAEAYYVVENQDLLVSGWVPSNPSSYITLSFWAKSSVAGTYVVQARGTSKVFSYYYTLAANTWKKITVTIPGDASNSITNDNNGNFRLYFNLDTGTAYTDNSNSPTESWFTVTSESNYYVDYSQRWLSNAGATFNFTGVQLEYGKVQTPFEIINYTNELIKCQRYYENSFPVGTVPGIYTGECSVHTTAFADGNCPGTLFKVTKRVAPTVTLRAQGLTTTGQVACSGGTKTGAAINICEQQVSYIAITSGVGGSFVRYTFEANAEF